MFFDTMGAGAVWRVCFVLLIRRFRVPHNLDMLHYVQGVPGIDGEALTGLCR
jgi:hypothetical protein